jgi:hypothetical protein
MSCLAPFVADFDASRARGGYQLARVADDKDRVPRRATPARDALHDAARQAAQKVRGRAPAFDV